MRKIFLSLLALISVSGVLSSRAIAFTLPDTGQTKCYDTAGTEIACAGTGQDGEYNINPMSYTDNGNGTITDNVTGLMWQKEDDNKTRNWAAAGTYCDSLTLAGHTDWRLPTKKELMSLVDYSRPYPGPTINTTYFPNTNSGGYWSSTSTVNPYTTNNAWYASFGQSIVGRTGKSHDGFYARCVRGGQSLPSFTDNGNGTVTDNRTGLIWQQGEPGSMSWANALSYCEGLSLGGQTDWLLPNIKELESITDDTKYNPAIDTTYFPNAKGPLYLSSTTDPSFLCCASNVSFLDGAPGSRNASSAESFFAVRCVRGIESGSSGGSQNNCAATLSSDLKLHIPILTFNGQSYWADLQYSSGSNFTLSNAMAVTDTSSYSGCTAATLSSDYKLHISVMTYNNVSYWADFQYVPDATFTLTGAEAN